MPGERLYTEKEISKILEKAGEKQANQGAQETHGLTLAELKQIAADVGLDPALVASVASELDASPARSSWFSQLGVPTKINVERIIPGKVSEDDWPEIVRLLEESLGIIGASGQIGKSLEWTHTSKFVQYRVSFHPVKDGTKVRVFGNLTRQALALTLPLTLFFALQGFLIPFASGFGAPGSLGVGLVAGMLVYMLIRFGFTSSVRRRENTINRTISRIERVVNLTEEEPAKQTPESPRLDLEESNEKDVETPLRKKGRQRN